MSPIASVVDLRLRGRRVFLRADLNVPLRDGAVADDTRIRASQETLDFARTAGSRVILASHLGRPREERQPELSLAPVARELGLELVPDCVGPEVEARVARLRDGEALLLENLRFHAGETKNDPEFSAALARLCDAYVNDAFGAAHRAHASIAGIAALIPERAAGLLLEREIRALTRVRDHPEPPFVCLLGGAKVSDKLAVLESLARRASVLIVAGAMAYTFLLARGEPVGRSLVEPERVDAARRLLDGPAEIVLPVDHVVTRSADEAEGAAVVTRIPSDRVALDIGPASIAQIAARLKGAATLFWNGPVGRFERPPFDAGTRAVAKLVAESGAYTVVGGGDSLAAIAAAGVGDRISHLSTGGGASLEFLEGRTLPGIAALEKPA
ncbi:MAG: phosphoglycerate kinase [Myxococcota bacterium]